MFCVLFSLFVYLYCLDKRGQVLLAFHPMQVYVELLKKVLEEGELRSDRTGTGALGVFGAQVRIDLSEGFPLLTTKKIHLKSVIYELLWFLQGNTNVHYLNEHGVSIWDEWADKEGNLGPVYGAQWRSWRTADGRVVDQIARVIEQIQQDPYGRRHLVSAWNVGELEKMALPPCHVLFQFYVSPKRELSCQLYQRSADLFLGVPFNIASYALLTSMLAQVCHLKVKEFIHTFGDLHIYQNHLDQVRLQLSREPRPLPTLRINPTVQSIDGFRYEDFELIDYNPYPSIKAPIAI